MNTTLAPIILFVYNRPDHAQQVIDSLLNNPLAKESDLYIYSDAPKDRSAQEKVKEVRNYIRSIAGFKSITIIYRERNYGLAKNIINGVTEVINQYGKVIVLEDDLLLSPHFLEYMNTALTLYQNDKQVACITAFNFPLCYPLDFQDSTFFIKGADCWTWATWERAWEKFEINGEILLEKIKTKNLQKEFDLNGSYPYTKMLQDQICGKNNSWAIRWYASAFLENMLCLYPKDSLVENIGYDGTHFKHAQKSEFFGKRSGTLPSLEKISIQENLIAKQALCNFLKRHNSLLCKILRKIQLYTSLGFCFLRKT